MTTLSRRGAGLTGLGLFISFLMVVGLIAVGAYVLLQPEPGKETSGKPSGETPTTSEPRTAAGNPGAAEPIADLIEPLSAPPRLEAAATYVPKNNVIDVDISEYAGYAGLIVANGGLEPNPESIFTKQFGVTVKLTLSEGENWSQLNNGKMAASATTVDVLAVMGRQFQVTAPVQIAFSRGADGIVVSSDIKKVNDLGGKVLVTTMPSAPRLKAICTGAVTWN